MKLVVLLLISFFFGTPVIPGQVWRAGALDNQSSMCRGNSCVWASADPVHPRLNGLEFYLDPTVDDPSDRTPVYLVVRGDTAEILRTQLDYISASVAITCSNKCHFMAVTWSDGGSIGNFHTKVFAIENGKARELHSTGAAFSHFEARHDCSTRGDNIQAYRFEDGGAKLFLLLSVYNTSDCGLQMGFMQGYRVDSETGKILSILNLRRLNAYLRRHPEGY